MVVIGLVLASLLSLVQANPLAGGRIVLEQRNQLPDGFVHSGAASGDTNLNLRVALVSSDIVGLQNSLMDVSTPSSPNYGQHLSKKEVEAFVRPAPETVSAVNEFFSSNGINTTTITPTGDWLAFSIPVNQANSLFGANFSVFTHQESGQQAVRTLSYSIPALLHGQIELVHPTVSFPNPLRRTPIVSSPAKAAQNITGAINSRAVPASCASSVTPACLQDLYAIPTTKSTQSSNALGVTGYDNQFANQADLESFLAKFRPDMSSSTTFTLQTLDGGQNSQNQNQAGIEADLDIQYTVGIATGVPTVFLSVGDDNQDGDLTGFLDTINFLLGETSPPQVLTTSYGPNESDVSRALTNNLCNAYAQLGARGTSVLFATGDGGVSGTQTSSCKNFVPTFPCGCPFMTGVGATTGVNPETGASLSAGGFSNYFGIPSYQASAVKSYLSTLGNTNKGLFNASGRAYPDVAAQGENVQIFFEGSQTPVDGTSCSSPIFASIVALLNDELIAAGKPPLGFLNPFIYSTGASAFNDITSGNNPGCNTDGFPATTGWDPVTGVGSPNYAKLKVAVGL